MAILAIAGNTFRENIRDRILYNLILFAIIMIFSAVALGQLTLGHEDKIIVDLGLSSISIFGTLIAIFIGIGLVYKELERRTVYSLLAKPIHRHEFILGKFLGLLGTLLVNVIIMTLGLALTLAFRGGDDLGSYLRLVPAVYLIFLSLALTTALALLFSTFSTPALSAVFTLFLWVAGHFNGDLLEFGKLTESAAFRWFCNVLYYLLPNISNFNWINSRNVIQSAAYHQGLDPAAVMWVSVYALLYCGILLLLSIAIFSRRDFK
ncbi:MAG: putative transport system, permease component [Acidobacteria bacterium]|jgi:ABC-type transport system involved in multi-copper enzyme maturation permease subunit|nr:putative transport system, permease component [Acidobacteriota bacterium]